MWTWEDVWSPSGSKVSDDSFAIQIIPRINTSDVVGMAMAVRLETEIEAQNPRSIEVAKKHMFPVVCGLVDAIQDAGVDDESVLKYVFSWPGTAARNIIRQLAEGK
jgi:hypothetical protein